MSIGKDDFAAAGVSPDSDFALGVIIHGVRNEQTIYVARKAELDSGAAAWKKVADVDDEVTDVENHGSELYLLCHKDAPALQGAGDERRTRTWPMRGW